VNCCEKNFTQFVVTRGDASEIFDLIEKTLNAIALSILLFVVGDEGSSSGDRRDDRFDALVTQAFSDSVRIVAFVQDGVFKDIVGVQALGKALELPAVVGLSWCQMECHAAIFVDGCCVDLGC
jgi:hypothetical protein